MYKKIVKDMMTFFLMWLTFQKVLCSSVYEAFHIRGRMARGLLHHEDLVILVIGLCKHMKPLFMLFTMYVLHVAPC